jgi:hypothetical protein
MAEGTKKDGEKAGAAASPAAGNEGRGAKRIGPGIRLIPVEDSDQPVLANYTMLNIAPGMAFIDFGFLEPAMLSALPQIAKQGGKMPESVNGKLTVRVALGFDSLANLHQQMGRILVGLTAAAAEQKKSQAGK